MACAYKNVGLGGGLADSAGAFVEIHQDHRVWVGIGAAEVGQGLVQIAAALAAEVLGIPIERVEVTVGDTARTPDGGPTTASRQTYITGNAVRLAAEGLRQRLAVIAAEKLNAAPDNLVFQDGRVIRPDGHSMSFGETASLARSKGRSLEAFYEYRAPTTVSLGQPGDAHFAYGFGTQAAQVEVDLTTGEVKVLRLVAAHDVGRAVNPMAIEGQIEGGIMMGIGYALTEEFLVEGGYVKSDNLTRYKVPSIRHMPQVHPIILEYRASEGPFGAKGVGEVTTIPTAPAILNAIYHACGARLTRLPATPQRVLAALRK